MKARMPRPARKPSHLHHLRTSVIVLAAGLAVAFSGLVAVVLVILSDWHATTKSNEEQARILATVMEDQTTRMFDSADLAFGALSRLPSMHAAASTSGPMVDAMQQVLSGLPFLRGVAVVDARGHVIASTSASDAGATVNLGLLGDVPSTNAPGSGKIQIGPMLPGRGLADLAPTAHSRPVPRGVAVIPLLYRYQGEQGDARTLVGLINPDALSNFQHVALESVGYETVIASYAGQVFATSDTSSPAQALIGQSVKALPVFQQYLPQREHGSYIGTGVLSRESIVAFRVSRSQPIVVVVEEPLALVRSMWLDGTRNFSVIGVALVLVVCGLSLTMWRGLQAREATQRAMEAAQQRIARSERDMSLLMRSVQELIFRTDARGVLTFVNARWSALSGQDTGSALGQRLMDIVDPSSKPAIRALLDPASMAGLRTCQALVRSQDGKEMLFDVAVVPLAVNQGIQGFAGSAVDVTERWRAEQKLQAQLAFQHLLLETSPLPMSLTDTEGRIVLVNRAWEEYKGRKRQDVMGLALHDFLPEGEAQVHASHDRQLLRWGGDTQLELKVRHGDGSCRDTRIVKTVVLGSDGKPTGILNILMDISEFREAERATQEARDAMEEAFRAKSEFVANMSHELRTPLQSIIGFAELGTLRGKKEPRLAEMFADIHAAGQRMLALVNDLLDVAKIESTVGTIHLEKVDLRGLIRPIAREFEPLLVQRQLDLQLHLDAMPLIAKADPVRFQQVIRNILANAVKFSPSGSRIEIHGAIDAQGSIQISIKDRGPGIPPEELDSIFEAFVQSSKTKDGSGGTGLGLAICKKIIEALGGRIFARNRSAGGTAFHIVLPARSSMDTQPAPLQ